MHQSSSVAGKREGSSKVGSGTVKEMALSGAGEAFRHDPYPHESMCVRVCTYVFLSKLSCIFACLCVCVCARTHALT
jgi:hypothetical protein